MHECMRGGCVQRRRWLFNYGTPDLSGLRASLLACGPGLVTQTCWKDQSPGRMGWDDGGHGPPSCPPVSWLGLEGSTACSHRVQYAPCWPTNVNHPTSTSTVWLILPLSWLRPSVPAHLPTTRLTDKSCPLAPILSPRAASGLRHRTNDTHNSPRLGALDGKQAAGHTQRSEDSCRRRTLERGRGRHRQREATSASVRLGILSWPVQRSTQHIHVTFEFALLCCVACLGRRWKVIGEESTPDMHGGTIK